MVTVLLWIFGVFAVTVILLFLYGFYLGFTEQTTYRAVISLYDIRRRIQVAQFKTKLRWNAADLRRALQRDLDEQGKL
jgi:hypothetical protein